MENIKPGLKITIEGPTACGKQSVVDLIENALKESDKKYKYTIVECVKETIEVVE